MRRTISSQQTFGMKFVFPTGWIGAFGIGTCVLWFGNLNGPKGPPPVPMKWAFLAVWLIGSTFIIWFSRRIKRVQVDDNAIYVSNYWSEVRIPLTEISHFTQSYMSRPPTITIHLRGKTPVGERVVFIPQFRWVLFGTHPTIIELEESCKMANARDGGRHPIAIVKHDHTMSMRVFQAVCALLCLLSVFSAATGIQSVSITDHVAIVKQNDLGRAYALVSAAVLALAVYGIQKRAPVTWKLGWVVLAASFASFLLTALPGTTRLLLPGRWIASAFILVGTAFVSIFWGLWWKLQRDYFRPQQERDSENDINGSMRAQSEMQEPY